jgi:hypothetical protein
MTCGSDTTSNTLYYKCSYHPYLQQEKFDAKFELPGSSTSIKDKNMSFAGAPKLYAMECIKTKANDANIPRASPRLDHTMTPPLEPITMIDRMEIAKSMFVVLTCKKSKSEY